MAQLLNDRNKLLSSVSRVIGRAVSLSSGNATAFTIPKNSTSAIPGTVIVTATTAQFLAPVYSWSYRFGDSGNFTNIPGASGASYNIIGDSSFVSASADYTLVQYKVHVQETENPTASAEDIITLYVLREGTSSVVGQLSNDTLIVYSDTVGNVDSSIYPNLISTLTVYNGTIDDSANWTISITKVPAGVTAAITAGKTISITSISSTFISGIIEVTASRQGYASITKGLSITKISEPEDAVSYVLEIDSTNGTVFRVGENRQTILKARVFKNGVEITDSLASENFKWTRVSMDPPAPPLQSDAEWNALHVSGFKQILVDVDDVLSKATFHCELIE